MGCKISKKEFENSKNKYKNITYDNVEWFTPIINEGLVLNVYDGDTITIGSFFDNNLFKFNVRLYGIDTPEIKSKNISEKHNALICRDALREKILDKIVTIKNIKSKNGKFLRDKYGRMLCEIYYNNSCINDWMLANTCAKQYFGGTK